MERQKPGRVPRPAVPAHFTLQVLCLQFDSDTPSRQTDKTQKKAVKATRKVRSKRSPRRAEGTSEQILLHPGRASADGICQHC